MKEIATVLIGLLIMLALAYVLIFVSLAARY
jgi:hypothetical protein